MDKKETKKPIIKSHNKVYGYYGESFKKHKGNKRKADQHYSEMALKVKELTGENNNEKIQHYLDSNHGRHLINYSNKPEYIKLDFARFNKKYNPQNFYEETQLSKEKELNELDKHTLKSYIDKASSEQFTDGMRYMTSKAGSKKAESHLDKMEKRLNGIRGASRRLVQKIKEEQMKEKFEQIDEISKEKMYDYINKAHDQTLGMARNSTDAYKSGDYRTGEKLLQKSLKRNEGIKMAFKKYREKDAMKEEISEDVNFENPTLEDMIFHVLDNKPGDAQEVFSDLMLERIRAGIEQKKIELATSLINNQEDEFSELENDDITEETIEDLYEANTPDQATKKMMHHMDMGGRYTKAMSKLGKDDVDKKVRFTHKRDLHAKAAAAAYRIAYNEEIDPAAIIDTIEEEIEND